MTTATRKKSSNKKSSPKKTKKKSSSAPTTTLAEEIMQEEEEKDALEQKSFNAPKNNKDLAYFKKIHASLYEIKMKTCIQKRGMSKKEAEDFVLDWFLKQK